MRTPEEIMAEITLAITPDEETGLSEEQTLYQQYDDRRREIMADKTRPAVPDQDMIAWDLRIQEILALKREYMAATAPPEE